MKQAENSFSKIVNKCIGIIVAFTLIGGILAFIYSETMIVSEFESSVTVIVNNKKTDTSGQILSSDISASKMLVDTYVVIVKSDTVLNEVSVRLNDEKGIAYSVSELRRMIKASSVDETEIFEIVVRNTNPEYTREIANMIASVAPEKIKNYVEASSVKVINYAGIGKRVAPNVQINMLIGLVIGNFLGSVFAIIKIIVYLCRRKGKSENQTHIA